ncbi:heavy metal translocating P-type ATPase [Devosia sp. XJ19-1]|uniref:P-type Zn(2+) transporter n=1 Tax=Devosia ureilytica TaxID=2952754 RepID=A0A9Q4AQ77_9HYPH|nr:heavy metal translocating P-type ATPase [Devosia ureilytica]MCP8884727.1 heavy metal translocating P-type ATPase [Devosia ureilytica]MCP8888358.1 heavy metal translocating P-type ATPase [Devosia ureilytica]
MTEAIVTKFRIGGMDCANCASKVENAVSRVPGVTEVGASYTAQSMSVTHTGVPLAAIRNAVKAVGYTAAAANAAPEGDHAADHFELGDGPWWKTRKAMLTWGCGLALAAAYLIGQAMPDVGHWAFLAALLVGLVPIGRRAISGAMHGTPFSIETLMSIAAIGAVFIGATEEAATVVLLFLVGELLEGVAAGRARASIRGLTDLIPKTALVERNGQIEDIPAEALAIGDILIIRPGDRIAADGDIVEGDSAIEEAAVTGESVPRRKGMGDPVFAGTINTDAVLRVKVTAAAADNTIARVVKLVEEAQESKAPTERFIDRFSKVYTPGVLVVGALVAVVPPLVLGWDRNEWIYKGLAVLLIGCPCALVISTPAAIAAGLSAGARRGLLLKGGAVLEGLRNITAVAFDKTGTLTAGKPVVTDIIAIGRTETQLLSMAAALESGSSHPLALAILAKAKGSKAPVPPAFGAKALAGKGVSGNVGGVEALLASPSAAAETANMPADLTARVQAFNDEGKTVSVLLANGQVAGLFAIRDEARPDAVAGLKALRNAGIATVMLTGDNRRTAMAIGAGLGIEVKAELMPEDKQRIVREMQSAGQVVAKVGDGINDAPAIAAADIGIAMGGGTDVALETAHAAVLHGRVADIPAMIDLSEATMSNITQNIVIALGLKAVFLVTTIVGITGLWPAILADTGATVLVTANAMRLLGWKPKQD